ncbi:hypothetical protein ACIP01_11115 [Pseudomonas monteilii]|uniref:hypothetical protein n=1 Tax=Pseudomonas monteilii TaxID=76759 RepID=UPI0037FE768B
MKDSQRYDLIMGRQSKFVWGDGYIAAIQAVAAEAPRNSRVCRINSLKIGRVLHCLSTPERIFAQFALFNPRLIDIHEQKMLSQVRGMHPLYGHPLARGKDLLPVCGTLDAAERIGMKHHVVLKEVDGKWRWVPYPYTGDLLLYLKGSNGSPYAVNWNVKDTEVGFIEKNIGKIKTPRKVGLDKEKIRLRTLLEEQYYMSAGIRTVKMSRERIDRKVVSNIFLLYGLHERSIDIEPQLLSDYSAALNESLMSGMPLAHVAITYGKKWGHRDQFLTRIYQDIWSRRLKVDMFQPIQINRPSQIEDVDIHLVYENYFSEGCE